jgi:uncharacterized protein YjbI with pentapeptide repeats
MKFLTWITGLFLIFFCWVLPAQAANPNPVTQLLESRSCVGCNLEKASLQDLDLRGVNLSKANLKRANLRGAQLAAVNLREANLQGADLTNADILMVDVTGANLKDAKFDGTSLEHLKICHTIAPNGKLSNRNCD